MRDSSIPASGFNNSSSTLERGLAALKGKNYPIAIDYLTEVCQTEVDRLTLIQAQMGLVKAYRRTGDMQQARSLCETLSQNSSRKVRAWATENLAKLNLEGSAIDRTGFVPLAVPPVPAAREQIDSIDSENIENPFQLVESTAIAQPDSAAVNEAQTELPKSSSQPQFSRTEVTGSPQRAQKWATLGSSGLESLAMLEIGTAIATVWLVYGVVAVTLTQINRILARTMWPFDLRYWAVFYQISIWPTIFGLAVLLAIAPWLIDALLQRFYGLKPFSLSELERYSPEASRLLKRGCSQRRLSVPTLGWLAIDAPVALTYGNLQRTARIVLSRGLLAQLDEAEIAAICAGELAHVVYWDFVPLTLVALVTQIPYLIYWQVADWGDRSTHLMVRSIAAVVSALSYGLYWLGRWPGLWLARVRQYYSDRLVCNLTGNPNGLTVALLKLTSSTAGAIAHQGSTHPLLESFDLLLPIAPRAAVSQDASVLKSALEWDVCHPGRHWLTANNSHPRLGDRLARLARYARLWRLVPAVELRSTPVRSTRLQLQAAPFLGVVVGAGIALLLWVVGAMGAAFDWPIDWLRGDRGVLWGLMLMGFSFGTLLRFNAFFPDIRSTNTQTDPALADLLNDPAKLPADSQPVRLHGRLIGRSGIRNWLVQDLLLQTEDGLIKLHYLSQLGAAGNLLLHPNRPDTLVGRSVTVTGWFRRGTTVWIDVETIRSQSGATFRSGHPLWSTLLAIAVALLGASLILQS